MNGRMEAFHVKEAMTVTTALDHSVDVCQEDYWFQDAMGGLKQEIKTT